MPVILATWEAEIGRIAVSGQSRQIVHETLHLQNSQSKMDWRCGSSGRVPALQCLQFKLQSHQKKKKKAIASNIIYLMNLF
jgi:hypothetical protein